MRYGKVIVNVVYVTLKQGIHKDLPTKEIPGVRRCPFKSANYCDVIFKKKSCNALFVQQMSPEIYVSTKPELAGEHVLFFRFSSVSQYIDV